MKMCIWRYAMTLLKYAMIYVILIEFTIERERKVCASSFSLEGKHEISLQIIT